MLSNELRHTNQRRLISFWNGAKLWLNWFEYQTVRNMILEGYKVTQVGADLVNIEGNQTNLLGTLEMLNVLQDVTNGTYNCDCKDKIVLDVGGFQGESAVLFSKMGAKKVLIYEPISAHQNFIRRNVSVNNVWAEIHEEGVGDWDGIETVNYDTIDCTVGILSRGKNQMKIRMRNVGTVIEESNADIAKFDCEGAEESLVHLSPEVLRKVAYCMIETHTPKIREAIVSKFVSSGFKLVKEKTINDSISVIHFKRNIAHDRAN
jgi:FkbM family methyltransferase